MGYSTRIIFVVLNNRVRHFAENAGGEKRQGFFARRYPCRAPGKILFNFRYYDDSAEFMRVSSGNLLACWYFRVRARHFPLYFCVFFHRVFDDNRPPVRQRSSRVIFLGEGELYAIRFSLTRSMTPRRFRPFHVILIIFNNCSLKNTHE